MQYEYSNISLLCKTEQSKYMAKKNKLTTSDYLEYSEYQRLLDCLHKDGEFFWELYARLGFCTACRSSDVLNLRWEDILCKDEYAGDSAPECPHPVHQRRVEAGRACYREIRDE